MTYMPKPKDTLNKRALGKHYELKAIGYLTRKGYEILKHNFYCPFGEIDIIAKDKEYIVFVEVKYRRQHDYGYPREAVNYKKQCHIRRSAAYYLKQQVGYEVACRFDVVEILEEQITHLEAAF